MAQIGIRLTDQEKKYPCTKCCRYRQTNPCQEEGGSVRKEGSQNL